MDEAYREAYRYITEQPCPKCHHVHPKDDACIIAVTCFNCGSPAGLYAYDAALVRECHRCFMERTR